MKNSLRIIAFTLIVNSLFAGNCICYHVYYNPIKLYQRNTIKDDTLTLVGDLVKEPFITKNGKPVPGLFDFYFKTENEKYFIKANESIFSKEKLEELMKIDNKSESKFHKRRFKVVLKTGDWDADPKNPELQQSRVGKYIIITQELKPIEEKLIDKLFSPQEKMAFLLADSVAKVELKEYNRQNNNMLSDGQLSLEYYNKTIESLAKNINSFEVIYKFNQPLGGKVMLSSFCVIVNVDTKVTQFVRGR